MEIKSTTFLEKYWKSALAFVFTATVVSGCVAYFMPLRYQASTALQSMDRFWEMAYALRDGTSLDMVITKMNTLHIAPASMSADAGPEALREKMRYILDERSKAIEIFVVWDNPQTASDVANIFAETLQETYAPPATPSIDVRIVRKATPPNKPVPFLVVRSIGLTAMMSMVLVFFALLMIELMRGEARFYSFSSPDQGGER